MPNKAGEFDSSEITADLAALRADVGRLSDALTGFVRGQAESATTRIRNAAGDAKSQMSQAAGSARDGALAAAADMEGRIGKSPLTAVLIAAAIGLALGVMSRSRG